MLLLELARTFDTQTNFKKNYNLNKNSELLWLKVIADFCDFQNENIQLVPWSNLEYRCCVKTRGHRYLILNFNQNGWFISYTKITDL